MDLVLVLLIGAAVGFSVGIYVARQYGASPKLEIWKREIIRDISSQLSQRSQELNNPDKALIKLSEGLVDKISQKLQEKLQAVQATLEEFKFRLADSQQSLLQDWGRDLLQAISSTSYICKVGRTWPATEQSASHSGKSSDKSSSKLGLTRSCCCQSA
ncbi:hypothetical protein [Synechococcus sp. R6-6]|uniref:hypothetical protein n=1 Tax=unclassified Synechococcus TaxID=2626047 RepID=UPI0039C31CE0